MIEESKHGLLACFNTDSNFGFVFANTFNRTDDHETSWTDSTYFYLTHNATDTLTLEQHSKFQDSQTKWKLDTATDGQQTLKYSARLPIKTFPRADFTGCDSVTPNYRCYYEPHMCPADIPKYYAFIDQPEEADVKPKVWVEAGELRHDTTLWQWAHNEDEIWR